MASVSKARSSSFVQSSHRLFTFPQPIQQPLSCSTKFHPARTSSFFISDIESYPTSDLPLRHQSTLASWHASMNRNSVKRRPRPQHNEQKTPQPNTSSGLSEAERLQKVVSRTGIASRREVEKLIEQRKVSVNGKVVTTQGMLVNSRTDIIKVNGKDISYQFQRVWIAIHKPKGYVCTEGTSTKRSITSLIPRLKKHNLIPIGRIDQDASGIVLLTNERQFIDQLSSPQNSHIKEWFVDCKGIIQDSQLEPLRNGIKLRGDKTPTPPSSVMIVGTESVHLDAKNTALLTRLDIRIRDSRRHIIQRMFEAINIEIVGLSRRSFGPVLLGSLKRGDHRYLTQKEIKALKRGVSERNIKSGAHNYQS